MSWQGRRVLVTGAGGFIGSHLAERLVREGATVRAMVRYCSTNSWGWLDTSDVKSEIEVVASDIVDHNAVEETMKDVDVVFHLAALIGIPYSYVAPDSYVRTNIQGTLNVLQSARRLGTQRVVHTSTSEVYGTALRVPIDEGHPLQGQSPYSASKISADKLTESFNVSFDLPTVTVRPFNTYGPRQSARAVIPTIITQALAGDEISLGSLTPTRDFTYVDDTVSGFLAAATCDAAIGKTLNLGVSQEISIADLAERIVALIGGEASVKVQAERQRPSASEVERLLSDNSLMRKLTGWEPAIDLDEGLRRTIGWIEGNLDRFRVGDYVV